MTPATGRENLGGKMLTGGSLDSAVNMAREKAVDYSLSQTVGTGAAVEAAAVDDATCLAVFESIGNLVVRALDSETGSKPDALRD